MVGAHQNLNGSRDLIQPLSTTVCHGLALATTNLSTKFEVSHYEDMKAIQTVENGVVWGNYGPLKVTGNSTVR